MSVAIACVYTGTKYSFGYVMKLRNMIARNMRLPYTFFCLTDQPDRCDDVLFIDVTEIGLPGWWAKMILFETAWRGRSQVIYFDLDTVILNDITPLVDVPHEFAILESPVRLAGKLDYPCRYNSSCMVIGAGRCGYIWEKFEKRQSRYMLAHDRYGDQAAVEDLYPDAALLQRIMPKGFFLNYRNLTRELPKASVINFGGRNRPHNCEIPWVQAAWE